MGSSEFKVGLFTLVGLASLGYIFFVLSPDTFQRESRHRYYTVVKDAAGIVQKTHVKTNGVVIGKVSDIHLQVNDTRIEVSVDSDVKIPHGSRITIKEKGLLGDVFLEIVRADDQGHYLRDGDFIPPATDQVSLSALLAIGGSIAKDVKKITASIASVVGTEEGASNVASFLEDVRAIVSNGRDILVDNKKDLRLLIGDLAAAGKALRTAMADREGDLVDIVGNIRDLTGSLKEASHSMEKLLRPDNRERVDKIIASFDNTMQDVEVTARNVRLVAAKLERGEGTLGKLLSDDDTLDEFEEALKDVRQLLEPATKLRVAVDYHGELRRNNETQHYFNMIFRTRPDKYYLLGLTDLHEQERIERVVPGGGDDSVNGDGTSVTTYVSEKKALRFNAQVAKRWGPGQLRFGLFETTGGIAADLYLLDDRLRWSLEAFDWNNASTVRKTAHLKSSLTAIFYDHLYAVVGVDDPTRLDPATGERKTDLNYFFGAGLSFDDQDLKAVFGTAAAAL